MESLSTFSKLLLRSFPPPRLLLFSGVGLEVSEHSLKHLAFEGRTHRTLGAYGAINLEPGIIEHGEIQNPEALTQALTLLREKVGTRFVHVSLPEQRGYVFRVVVPREGDLSPREAVEFRLEEQVPLPAADIVFDCEELPLESTATERALNVTAFPRATLEMYYDTLSEAGFVPLSFEMESQALARAVIRTGDTETRMIVDFGETRTVIAVSERGVVRFTTSLEIAGLSLSAALLKGCGVEGADAERLKNEEGISAPQSKTAQALLPSVKSLADELRRHFVYWKTHGEAAGVVRPPISSVILCGGNSNLKGLSEYLSGELKTSVSLAQVWQNAFSLGSYLPELSRKESLRFATVAGLALRTKATHL